MNLFAGQNIMLPNEMKEHFHRLCQTRVDGYTNRLEDSPFPRMVDLWFAGFCLAAKKNLAPAQISPKLSYNAIEGNVFGSDNYRSDMMVLFCVSKTGSIEIITEPAKMLRLVNEYAVTGLKEIISVSQNSRGDDPLDFLSEYFSLL